MAQLTTEGVTISATSTFQNEYSDAQRKQFVFSYHIEIRNDGEYPIQLINRHWEVMDATGDRRSVDGEGVVGQQPVIEPAGRFSYNSWVQFGTRMGAMEGHFEMVRLLRAGHQQPFIAIVPQFIHLPPEVLN